MAICGCASDLEALPVADWVIDAAANPSVLAGVDGRSSSRQLIEHNLLGTLNLLEYCKRHKAGFILLSSSRVYSIPALTSLPMKRRRPRFVFDASQPSIRRRRRRGHRRSISGDAASFPVWRHQAGFGDGRTGIRRHVRLSGMDQSLRRARRRRTIRNRRTGHLFVLDSCARRAGVRCVILASADRGFRCEMRFIPKIWRRCLLLQMRDTQPKGERIFNAGGGDSNSMSLAELTALCDRKFGLHAPQPDSSVRPFDMPWVVMDSRSCRSRFGWTLQRPLLSILDEIAEHARSHPEWLDVCEGKRS